MKPPLKVIIIIIILKSHVTLYSPWVDLGTLRRSAWRLRSKGIKTQCLAFLCGRAYCKIHKSSLHLIDSSLLEKISGSLPMFAFRC